MERMFLKEHVGFVYQVKGLLYFSLVPSKEAVKFWQNLTAAGSVVEEATDLETTEEVRAFLEREAAWRREVWARMTTACAN